jgi:hypothetical protein
MKIDPLITPKEADTFLYTKTDWFELEKKEKEYFILISTGYMYKNWSCDGFDEPFDDLKRCCAYYAYAAYKEELYPEISGSVIEKTEKLGSLQESTKWGYSKTNTSISYIDDIMSIFCVKNKTNSIIYRT